MNENEIDFYLIPLKYKVKQYADVQLRFLEILPKIHSSKHKRVFLQLSEKINNGFLTKTDKRKVQAVVNIFELGQLKKKKKGQLASAYREEVLLKLEWICLQQALNDPINSFQGQFFEFYIHQQTKNIFGQQLASVIREVLRDGVITDVERDYICERAEELGHHIATVQNQLAEYESQNLAMFETIYDICKDGVITETEKKYLCQKAEEYKVKSSTLMLMVKKTLDLINGTQEAFKEDGFYESVLFLFLSQFFRKAGVEVPSNWFEKLYEYSCGKKTQLFDKEEKDDFIYKVKNFLENRFFGTSTFDDVKSIFDIFVLMGINPQDKSEMIRKVKSINKNLIVDAKLESSLNRNVLMNDGLNSGEKEQSVFIIGGEIYEFITVTDKNRPLFGFDVIGNKTIITINRDHYFHKDTRYFRLLIVTFVNNLKKNYASEDLVEEIQHLLNPPASVRINYKKPIYEIN